MRAALATISLLALAGLGWFYFARETEVTNYPSSGTEIIAFGDSLVAGGGASEGSDFVSLLGEQLGQEIVNLGVPGNTSADGLARVGEIDQYDAKVVILLLGGNDALRRTPAETTFQNLAGVIEHIHSRGAIVLLLGVRGGLLGDPYESRFEELAEAYGTAYVPNVLDGIFGNAELMADAIHPNDAGHRLIAERVYGALLPLLR